MALLQACRRVKKKKKIRRMRARAKDEQGRGVHRPPYGSQKKNNKTGPWKPFLPGVCGGYKSGVESNQTRAAIESGPDTEKGKTLQGSMGRARNGQAWGVRAEGRQGERQEKGASRSKSSRHLREGRRVNQSLSERALEKHNEGRLMHWVMLNVHTGGPTKFCEERGNKGDCSNAKRALRTT